MPKLGAVILTQEQYTPDLQDLALLSMDNLPWLLFHVFLLLNLQIHLIQYLPSQVPLARCLDSHCNPRKVAGASTKYTVLPQKADGGGFHGAAGLMKISAQRAEELQRAWS